MTRRRADSKRSKVSAYAALALSAFGASVLAGSGCGQTVPLRDCFARIWVPASHPDMRVIGSFTGWTDPIQPEEYDTAWKLARVELPPGEHGYLLEERGVTSLDPQNSLTTFREDGTEVSLLLIPSCDVPSFLMQDAKASAGKVEVTATFLADKNHAALDPKSVRVETSDGVPLHVDKADPVSGVIAASAALSDGKHDIQIHARGEDGADAEVGHASVWAGRQMETWRDGALYEVMIDRFRRDAGAALSPPATPSSFAGGTLDGVRSAIDAGYFDALGVTALWLSPVYDNPEEAREGLDGHPQNAYHGYWPEQNRVVEPRLGGEAALAAVVASAHARGIAVLLDIVPNHVYESNSVYTNRRGDAGFDLPGCICGTPGCDWGDHMLTCWFADYLPDVRYEDPASMDRTVDDARFWVSTFDLDGVRIDAVPMMPRATTRRIALGLREAAYPPESAFLLGEVFTGPGVPALSELRAHIGAPGLDSVFDFPAMWALRGAATGSGGFDQLEAVLAAEEDSFAGSGVVLTRQVDNHDVTRLLSEANGDAGADAWTAPPVQPTASEPYDRLELAIATNYGLPGMPMLWQGDEVGLAGGGDPDSRRVLPSDAALSTRQVALRRSIGRIAHVRSCSPALRRGDRTTISVDSRQYAFARDAGDGRPALFVVSSETAPSSVDLDPGPLAGLRFVDALTGESFAPDAMGTLTIPMGALAYRFLLTEGDPCIGIDP